MAQEEQALLALIYDTSQYARRAENDLQQCVLEPRSLALEPDEDLDDAQLRLRSYVGRMLLDLRILAERLGLTQTRQEMLDFQKEQKDLAAFEVSPEEPDVYVPALVRTRQYLQCLEALVNPEQSSQLNVFRTILQHTAKIIDESGLLPAKEADVRNKILQIASYSFTDAIKEFPMPQSVKTYRGDIGVPSIKAVAEYKFAKTKQEMKSCLDGIYADMKGYDGHSQWQHFFAVFYMKSPFFTQDHIEREFKKVGAASNWTPIVINGPTAGD
jgi:hypothetical protein